MSPTTSHLPPRIQTRSCISPPPPPPTPTTNHIPFLKSDHVCHPPPPQPIPLIIQTTSCMSPPPPPTTSLFLNQTMHPPLLFKSHYECTYFLLPPPPPPPIIIQNQIIQVPPPPHNTTQPNQQSSNTHTQNTHSPSFLSSLLPWTFCPCRRWSGSRRPGRCPSAFRRQPPAHPRRAPPSCSSAGLGSAAPGLSCLQGRESAG